MTLIRSRLLTWSLALAAVLSCTGAALASDVTGKWKGEFAGPDGNSFSLTFTFKQTGAELTGSVESPQGTLAISEGKVDGDKISFTVKTDDGGMTIRHSGSIADDEIKLEVKFDGGPEGGPGPMTLKRVKS